MKYRRLIHSVDPATGGPPEGIRQVTPELHARGWRGDVWCADPAGAPWLADFPDPVTTWKPKLRGYGWAPDLTDRLVQAAPRDGVDLHIVHGLWKAHGVSAWAARRRTGVPYVVFPHGMLDPWFRRAQPLKHLKKQAYWWYRQGRVLAEAAAVVFTCEEERRLAERTFWPYRVRARVVAYGIGRAAVEQVNPAALAAWEGRHPELRVCRQLLYLGRVDAKKGVDLLLSAWLAQRGQEQAPGGAPRLVLAGPGGPEWLAATRARAGAEGAQWLDATVVAPGLLRGQEKAGALAAAEAFILPSHQENFSLATVEALAAGNPVFITRQVNIWREVVAAGAGWAEEDTAAGVARLVRTWWEQPTAVAERAARAQACWRASFSVEAYADSFAALAREVVEGRA